MNINNLTSRIDKVRFLQNLQAGKASLNELKKTKVELWEDYSNSLGVFVNSETKEKLTTPEFQSRKKNKEQNKIYVEIINPF